MSVAPNNPFEFNTNPVGIDEYLAQAVENEFRGYSGEEKETDTEFDLDSSEELTVYRAARLAVERAVSALRGRKLSARANAFRSFLIDVRNRLRS